MIKAVTKKGVINIDDSLELGSGGEGIIYEIDSTTVAKIYHSGITPISISKFNFISKLDPNYFISPTELLYNQSGAVIGYTMKYIDQSFFPMSNIYDKSFCKANGIDKKIKMKIIEKLISAVSYAHKEKVVIGDLNPFNILVNNKGVVKFIDTDSYQTPGCPHSLVLLDDIRDYLYQGRVSENSDFFALSILSFNMLSFLHPFKGMHSTYKKLSDRMINKLPIFIGDPNIKIPKCYEPIQDDNFMSQFKRFYIDGDRFLLSISGVNNSTIATSPLQKPNMVKKYEQDELIVTMILQDVNVVNVNFLDRKGIIETDGEYIICDTSNAGYITITNRFQKSDWDKVYIGNENIILKKGNTLWVHNKGNNFEELKNFKFPNKYMDRQFENILVVIGLDDMYKLHIDKIGAGTIMSEHIGVYGKGFNNHTGLIHNSSGKQNLFYNSGQSLSIVQIPIPSVNGIFQKKNVGMVQYSDKKIIKTKLFKINGLKIKISNLDIDRLGSFAYISGADGEGTIFLPCDDSIALYRTNDFEKIGEMKCNLISSQTILNRCNAGIIAWEGNSVALLNKK